MINQSLYLNLGKILTPVHLHHLTGCRTPCSPSILGHRIPCSTRVRSRSKSVHRSKFELTPPMSCFSSSFPLSLILFLLCFSSSAVVALIPQSFRHTNLLRTIDLTKPYIR